MSVIPDKIDFDTAILVAFGFAVENSFSSLENVDSDSDPQQVREDFDSVLTELAERFGLGDDPETLGALADIVLEQWSDLNDFLVETTQ